MKCIVALIIYFLVVVMSRTLLTYHANHMHEKWITVVESQRSDEEEEVQDQPFKL